MKRHWPAGSAVTAANRKASPTYQSMLSIIASLRSHTASSALKSYSLGLAHFAALSTFACHASLKRVVTVVTPSLSDCDCLVFSSPLKFGRVTTCIGLVTFCGDEW